MAEEKPSMPPSRALVLSVMLSFLVASAVYVLISWLVIVPQMARQEVAIRRLQAEVRELREALEVEEDAAEDAAAPGAAPPAAPPGARDAGSAGPSPAAPAPVAAGRK